MKTLSALCLVALLSGCATQAQQQFQSIRTTQSEAGARARACAEAIYNSPEAAPIRPRVPMLPNDASLAQLADQTYAAEAEKGAVMSVVSRLEQCRSIALQALASTTPSILPLAERAHAESQDRALALVQHRITWGEFNRQRRDAYARLQAEARGEEQRIVGTLEQQHAAELSRRQQAADSMLNAAAAISAANQASRLPAGAYTLPNNSTSCTYGGGFINCH